LSYSILDSRGYFVRLNPCFCGSWFLSRQIDGGLTVDQVLILVFVEVGF